MKKSMILICLILLLSGCNAQPADVINEPKNDSCETVVETECEAEYPSIDDHIESIAIIPTESIVITATDISAESENTPAVDESSYVPAETESAVVDIKEEPIQVETVLKEPISVPPSAATDPESIQVQTTEPEVQKSAYDYEFDIEVIRQELLAVGESMGLAVDGSLTPYNSSWSNPVIASESFQGTGLERTLRDYVRSMPDIIVAYGGKSIQYFNIYAESLGGGSYQIYFLY